MSSVANIEKTAGGVDIEDDDSMKGRVYIAPSKYSVAGPEDAYKYWVKTYNASISDVLVKSDNPVEVIIEFIMENGELRRKVSSRGCRFICQINRFDRLPTR